LCAFPESLFAKEKNSKPNDCALGQIHWLICRSTEKQTTLPDNAELQEERRVISSAFEGINPSTRHNHLHGTMPGFTYQCFEPSEPMSLRFAFDKALPPKVELTFDRVRLAKADNTVSLLVPRTAATKTLDESGLVLASPARGLRRSVNK
jgi:hypothetical protein